LSECENRAIMKLGSRSVLGITEQLFGLEDLPEKVVGKCLEFDTGRVLLIGKWAPAGSEFLYTAMRRTVEGGRNLDDDYWASPNIPDKAEVNERKEDDAGTTEGGEKKAEEKAMPEINSNTIDHG